MPCLSSTLLHSQHLSKARWFVWSGSCFERLEHFVNAFTMSSLYAQNAKLQRAGPTPESSCVSHAVQMQVCINRVLDHTTSLHSKARLKDLRCTYTCKWLGHFIYSLLVLRLTLAAIFKTPGKAGPPVSVVRARTQALSNLLPQKGEQPLQKSNEEGKAAKKKTSCPRHHSRRLTLPYDNNKRCQLQ